MKKQKKICPFITRYPDETECFEKRCMAWGMLGIIKGHEGKYETETPYYGCKLIEKDNLT